MFSEFNREEQSPIGFPKDYDMINMINIEGFVIFTILKEESELSFYRLDDMQKKYKKIGNDYKIKRGECIDQCYISKQSFYYSESEDNIEFIATIIFTNCRQIGTILVKENNQSESLKFFNNSICSSYIGNDKLDKFEILNILYSQNIEDFYDPKQFIELSNYLNEVFFLQMNEFNNNVLVKIITHCRPSNTPISGVLIKKKDLISDILNREKIMTSIIRFFKSVSSTKFEKAKEK